MGSGRLFFLIGGNDVDDICNDPNQRTAAPGKDVAVAGCPDGSLLEIVETRIQRQDFDHIGIIQITEDTFHVFSADVGYCRRLFGHRTLRIFFSLEIRQTALI